MLPFAITIDGKPVYPERYSDADWQLLKDSYRVGDLLTPCCATPAIPKTSINHAKFFAHLSDECTTSPESEWHVSTKNRIVRELEKVGIDTLLEHSISGEAGRLKSDVYFECGNRRIAIEVQHSYQTFLEYQKRQNKYSAHGVENYWLLFEPRYFTIAKSINRVKLEKEYGGIFPLGCFFPCIPELPMAMFCPELQDGLVRGGSLEVPLSVWINSIVRGAFRYVDGAWKIA